MSSLLEVARTLGLSTLRNSRKAKSQAWEKWISAHFVTRCLQTLLNLGILDEMAKAGPLNVPAYCDRHGLDSKIVGSICEALYARGLLHRHENQCFSLDPDGEFLVANALCRGWLQLAHGYENVLYHLEDLARRRSIYGKDLTRDGRLVGIGSGLVSQQFYFPLVLKKLSGNGCRKVLDIGCGDAAFLRLFCRREPDTTGVGVDLSDDAIRAGVQQVEEAGLGSRILLHTADARQLSGLKEVLTGVDCATIFFVLHEFCGGPDHRGAVDFLRAFREALPGVRLVLVEAIRPTVQEMRHRPGPGIEYFLLHDLSNQHPVDRPTWRRIFKTAGFQLVEEDYIAFARTAIFTIQ